MLKNYKSYYNPRRNSIFGSLDLPIRSSFLFVLDEGFTESLLVTLFKDLKKVILRALYLPCVKYNFRSPHPKSTYLPNDRDYIISHILNLCKRIIIIISIVIFFCCTLLYFNIILHT